MPATGYWPDTPQDRLSITRWLIAVVPGLEAPVQLDAPFAMLVDEHVPASVPLLVPIE